MFAMFHRQPARPRTALLDFATAANFFLRWLSLPARRTTAHSLQLLQSVPLTAQASVALVRFESENLVLGVTSQSITVLAKGAAPAGARISTSIAEERQR
jgi:flagellar biogenesis protein FliO